MAFGCKCAHCEQDEESHAKSAPNGALIVGGLREDESGCSGFYPKSLPEEYDAAVRISGGAQFKDLEDIRRRVGGIVSPDILESLIRRLGHHHINQRRDD